VLGQVYDRLVKTGGYDPPIRLSSCCILTATITVTALH
jgi:hypothetical protein